MKYYTSPAVELLLLANEDVIRTSIENDPCEGDIFGEEE